MNFPLVWIASIATRSSTRSETDSEIRPRDFERGARPRHRSRRRSVASATASRWTNTRQYWLAGPVMRAGAPSGPNVHGAPDGSVSSTRSGSGGGSRPATVYAYGNARVDSHATCASRSVSTGSVCRAAYDVEPVRPRLHHPRGHERPRRASRCPSRPVRSDPARASTSRSRADVRSHHASTSAPARRRPRITPW